jgi:benzoate/toluate 1,2-dioxygenase alpha subunit/2,4,5-trichlorophenoxyacetic acid oxygenase 1
MGSSGIDVDALIDDRADAGIFRVRRDVFHDPAIFALEMEHIFEGTWLFLGLACQIPAPHDFFTTTLGRQPIIVMRDGAGRVGAFLNTCRHRGGLVCPLRAGTARFHICPYHGWAYDSAGRNVAITERAAGRYSPAFETDGHDLLPVARFGNYRGFLFASLSAEVPTLEEFLGPAATFIDLVIDQGADGVEFVPGTVRYTYNGNWKLQLENNLDQYHFSATHASFAGLIARRNDAAPAPAVPMPLPEPVGQGTFSLPNGHAVMWTNRYSANALRPLFQDPQQVALLTQRVGPLRAKWMRHNRNLSLFPNMQISDFSATLLRVLRPLAPDKTEMTAYCLALKGESAEARRRRIRQFEEFFNPGGLATPDDNVMYETAQAGITAAPRAWTQGYMRGTAAAAEPDLRHAQELGIAPVHSAEGTVALGDETCLHAGYREWRRLMRRATAG